MRFLLLLVALCFAMPSAQAQTGRRVALVIGNQDYVVGPARLARPHEDARLVHAALVSAGFDAGEAPLFDLDKPEFETALRDFARQARHAEAAVVYYAGHAIHALNETWLIPVGARLELQDDIRTEGIRLSDVVAIARRDGLSIVFLDACRDNPFASYRGGGGLPVTPPPEGSVVAYAAAAGHPAPDDGVYARALAARMQEEGVELRQLLNRVAGDVRRARNLPAELTPVAEIQLADTNLFYFRGAPATSPSSSEAASSPFAPLPPGHYRVDFRAGSNASPDRYVIAAEPFLRQGPVAVTVQSRVPSNSVVVFQNNAGAYGGRALTPTTGSDNFLTQIDTGNQAASFTLRFSRPLASVSFVVPALYAATESGVTFPAWRATAFDARGERLDGREDQLRGSWEDVNAQRHTLRAPASSAGIVTLQFSSDPRVNGVPFAAFGAIMIEELVLEPRSE